MDQAVGLRHAMVDASLPDGGSIRVQVVGDAGGIGSVGRRDHVDLGEALASVGRLASAVRDRLDVAAPSKATVTFGVGFTMTSGKLVSLLVGGEADASLAVTLEWEHRPDVS